MSKSTHLNYPYSSEFQEIASSQESEPTGKIDGDGLDCDQDYLDMSDLVCDEENYLVQETAQKAYTHTKIVPSYGLHLLYIRICCYELDVGDLIMSMVVHQFNFRKNHKLLRSAIDLYYYNRPAAVNKYGHIGYWNVAGISNFCGVFMGYENFNENINNWNMSSAKTTKNMFKGATKFNKPLNRWNMSNVDEMSGMFDGACNFNQSINSWNISKCHTLNGMFMNAHRFNQPLDKWDTSSIINMNNVFNCAYDFNQDISLWNMEKVKNMECTFANAHKFNHDISTWTLKNIVVLRGVFNGTHSFIYIKEFLMKLSITTRTIHGNEYIINIRGYIGHNHRTDRGKVGLQKIR